MNLYANEHHLPYGDAEQDTCSNDNGHFFLTLYVYLLGCHGCCSDDTAGEYARVTTSLESPIGDNSKGLYHRNPHRSDRLNSIDNYVALVAGSSLLGWSYIPFTIYNYGREHHWTYNNVNPGSWTWSAWRQPSERLFYALCAGVEDWQIPKYWMWWLHGAAVVMSFQDPLYRTSEFMMQWLRWRALLALYPGSLHDMSNPAVKRLVAAGGIGKVMERYFQDPQHPCVRLSKGLVL